MGRSLILLVLAGLLTACPGGGDDGGAGNSPTATPTQTIVSGSVQAPAGQIAFFKKSTLWDVFVSEAYAALTGLTSVPDNTIVQLARLNSNPTTFTVLATTATSGGKYSFNLTALGLQPAHDLIVRVAGPGGKEMRAFVIGTIADIGPVSEAASQLAIQALHGAPLSNLTLREVSDITGAVELMSTLQDIGNSTSVDQAVALVKTAVAVNTEVTGFIASAGASGQTNAGPGDIGNFYPFDQGNIWRYIGTKIGPGASLGYDNTEYISGQGPAPGHGVVTTVFSETNDEGENRAQDSYAVKGLSGITLYGNNDPGDNFTRQMAPFQVVHFPLTVGVTTVLGERSGLDWGTDEDGDGRNETVEVRIYQSVPGMESVIVPAGVFSRALRIETKVVFLVRFTRGGSGTAIQTNTAWHAPGVGRIKEIVEARIEGGSAVASLTEELIGYVANGQGSGLRIELGSPPVTMTIGATKEFRAALYDQHNTLIAGIPLSWRSSNESVLTVDENGIASAVSPGTASLTVASGSLVSNSVLVTIMDLRLVAMYTRDIAYDPVTNRIYASVSDNSANLSNTLVAIIPETGAVEWSAAVGPTPGKLAISDDGQYVYVGVNDGKTVVKVQLATRQVQQSFSLGTYAVLDMVALGGSSNSLVIARQQLLPSIPGGVAVYDGGVQRPLATPGWGESEARDIIPTILERSTSNSIVYGAGHGTVFTISIGASGATISSTQPISIDDRDMVHSDELLYFPSGEVYSPLTSSLQGTYPVPSIGTVNNKVLPYPSLNKVFFAQFFSAFEWLAFDRTTFAPAGAVNIFNIGTGSPRRFIRWGSNGLALSTDAGQLFIFRSTLFQ